MTSRRVFKKVGDRVATWGEASQLKNRTGIAPQIPRTGRLENVEAFNREAHALFRAYLEDHRDEVHVTDLGVAAFVCVTSIEALTPHGGFAPP